MAAKSSPAQWKAFLSQLIDKHPLDTLSQRSVFASLRGHFGDDVELSHRAWCKDTVKELVREKARAKQEAETKARAAAAEKEAAAKRKKTKNPVQRQLEKKPNPVWSTSD